MGDWIFVIAMGVLVLSVGAGVVASLFLARGAQEAPFYVDKLSWRLMSQGIWLGLIVLFLLLPVFAGVGMQMPRALFEYWPRSALLTVIVAAPMALIVASGGLDLSVGALASLVTAILAWMGDSNGIALGILLGIGVALVIGVIHGLLVSLGRMSSVIVTLLSASVMTGIVMWISEGRSIAIREGLELLGRRETAYLLWVPAILWVLMLAAAGLFMPFGRKTEGASAAGASEGAASRLLFIGLPFVLSSLGAALVGILTMAMTRVSGPGMNFGVPLTVVAAVSIGGTCFGARNACVLGSAIASIALAAGETWINIQSSSFFMVSLVIAAAGLCGAIWAHVYHGAIAWLYQRRRAPRAFPVRTSK